MWFVCDVLYAVLYVRVSCFVVHGIYLFAIVICVVNVFFDHLQFLVVVLMVECMSVVVNVMLSLINIMSPSLHCATYRYARW